ncbi:MAG: dethiobiotin synthase [Alphaproteobacteria bacterium]|nr:dethiobiotin synthase [Alphaproteobacteria bacterium]
MTLTFITATGTELGKTYVACRLIEALRARGTAVDAIKPVLSGFDPADAAASDSGLILQALGRPANANEIDTISPWRFKAPLSPDMAAEREGARLALDQVAAFCRKPRAGITLIEGAGGIMSPLGHDFTNLDLIKALDVRTILIAGTYLGTISHTLTACAVRPHAAIVLSESTASPVDAEETAATMARFTAAPIVVVRRGARVPQRLVDLITG